MGSTKAAYFESEKKVSGYSFSLHCLLMSLCATKTVFNNRKMSHAMTVLILQKYHIWDFLSPAPEGCLRNFCKEFGSQKILPPVGSGLFSSISSASESHDAKWNIATPLRSRKSNWLSNLIQPKKRLRSGGGSCPTPVGEQKKEGPSLPLRVWILQSTMENAQEFETAVGNEILLVNFVSQGTTTLKILLPMMSLIEKPQISLFETVGMPLFALT